MEVSRRKFLRLNAGIAGSALLLGGSLKALADTCQLTPEQAKGPFYPGESKFTSDQDLTTVPGQRQRAKGQVIYVKGLVKNLNCEPIVNANVEIWQACESGRYNHRSDPNEAPLDPNFQYWAEAFTNEKGEYLFKTILPGAYPADTDWTRPPHIHYRISALGYRELITQMYFKGQALNDKDLILQDIPEGERDSVIVEFAPSPEGFEPGSLMGTFDITLIGVR